YRRLTHARHRANWLPDAATRAHEQRLYELRRAELRLAHQSPQRISAPQAAWAVGGEAGHATRYGGVTLAAALELAPRASVLRESRLRPGHGARSQDEYRSAPDYARLPGACRARHDAHARRQSVRGVSADHRA